METVLVSILLTNVSKLIDLHTTTPDTFQVFTLSDLKLLLPKNSNSTAPSDVIPTRLCKIVLTNFPGYFIALNSLILRKTRSKSIQRRRFEAAHKEV